MDVDVEFNGRGPQLQLVPSGKRWRASNLLWQLAKWDRPIVSLDGSHLSQWLVHHQFAAIVPHTLQSSAGPLGRSSEALPVGGLNGQSIVFIFSFD